MLHPVRREVEVPCGWQRGCGRYMEEEELA
jgi:hypothetical protein